MPVNNFPVMLDRTTALDNYLVKTGGEIFEFDLISVNSSSGRSHHFMGI